MKTYMLKPLYWKIRFQLWLTGLDAYTFWLLKRYINWRFGKVQAKERREEESE